MANSNTITVLTWTKNKEAKDTAENIADEFDAKLGKIKKYKFIMEEETKAKNPIETLKKKIVLGLKSYRQNSYSIDENELILNIYGPNIEESEIISWFEDSEVARVERNIIIDLSKDLHKSVVKNLDPKKNLSKVIKNLEKELKKKDKQIKITLFKGKVDKKDSK